MLQQLIQRANINNTAGNSGNNSSTAAMHATTSPHSAWVVDSGASEHMTGDKSLFSNFSPCKTPQTVRIANGTRTKVVGTGIIYLSNTLILNSVLFVPDLDCSLISVSRLNRDLNCETKFLADSCVFQDLSTGKMIGSAEYRAGLYILDVSLPSSHFVDHNYQSTYSLKSSSQSNKESAIMMWHFRLGHPNFMYLKHLFPSLFINKNPNSFHCEVCQLAKHTRNTYAPRQYQPSHPFTLIHGDIWGPF